MTGTAPGKIIFFGEHFVVHGLPGIVAALDTGVVVDVKRAEKFHVIDNSLRFPGVPKLTTEICERSMRAVQKHLGIKNAFEVTLSGDLVIPHSGIGSSAAHLVAFTRALNKMFSLGLSEQEICDAALEGEKVAHGTPSGIDNTAATFGGVFLFEKGAVTPITLRDPLEIVLVESGKQTGAKEVIAALKELKAREPEMVKEIFAAYKQLAKEAYRAFVAYDLPKIGELMNKNHELLQALTLSCDELESAIKIAREAGALGAKLTGAGRGGLAVALAPGNRDAVVSELKRAGYAATPARSQI